MLVLVLVQVVALVLVLVLVLVLLLQVATPNAMRQVLVLQVLVLQVLVLQVLVLALLVLLLVLLLALDLVLHPWWTLEPAARAEFDRRVAVRSSPWGPLLRGLDVGVWAASTLAMRQSPMTQ